MSNWIKSMYKINWPAVEKDNFWSGDIDKLKNFQKGDKIIFYVKESNYFRGIFEVVKEAHKFEYTWPDKSESKYGIDLKPIQLGFGNFKSLSSKLKFCSGKTGKTLYSLLRNSRGNCGNNNSPISNEDCEIIQNELKINQIRPEKYIQEEKFELLHKKFLKYIYEESIKAKFLEEESVFKDFSNKFLRLKEIEDKNNIVQRAKEILELEKWNEFIKTPGKIVEKLKEICDKKVSDQLLSAPKYGKEKGQDKNLYNIKNEQIPEFEKIVFDLFLESTKEETFSKNFDVLVKFLKSNEGLSVNSQFLAYLAFIADKERYIPIRETWFDEVLKYFQCYEEIKGFSWEKYNSYLKLIKSLQNLLSKKYPTPNTIETHSYLWEITKILKNERGIEENSVSKNEDQKNEKFEKYFKILEDKKQVIFFGPPGTGKTRAGVQLARAFVENNILSARDFEGVEINKIVQRAEISSYADDQYHKYVLKEIEDKAKEEGYTLTQENDSEYLYSLKKSGNEIRMGVNFSSSSKQNPEDVYLGVPTKTVDFLSGVPEYNRYQLIINDSVKNFLLLPYEIEQRFARFVSGIESGKWDVTGKGQHAFHVTITKDKAELPVRDGTNAKEKKYDCEKFVRNIKMMFGDYIRNITFHPSYSYEEFVEGIRPKLNTDQISYEMQDGIFKSICNNARSGNPDNKYVLFIDEINRGNISKIFGELITLIENDKRERHHSTLTYTKESFTVPKNLYIIGTMNTADKSLSLLDLALRRRFGFIELVPNYDIIKEEIDVDGKKFKLSDILEDLNKKIKKKIGRERQIGHAYFMKDDKAIKTGEQLQSAFVNEIIPLLQEYHYEDNKALFEILGSGFVNIRELELEEKWKNNLKDFKDALEKIPAFTYDD